MKNAATFEIIGHVSTTQSGNKHIRITTCSNYRYKDSRTGEWKQDPHWNQTIAFADCPREAAAKLKKGDLVKITGRMKQSSYTNNAGQKVYSQDLVAWNIELIEKPAAANTDEKEREAA